MSFAGISFFGQFGPSSVVTHRSGCYVISSYNFNRLSTTWELKLKISQLSNQDYFLDITPNYLLISLENLHSGLESERVYCCLVNFSGKCYSLNIHGFICGILACISGRETQSSWGSAKVFLKKFSFQFVLALIIISYFVP